ncbi:MAG: DUF3726 domain-containing protein [Rhodobacteraceae bacterium]|nr:DUF3726 domain-containing protein [Paracoccaceae bacterium]
MIKRAAIGAGLCTGLAEEVAEASLWLIQHNAPGAAAAATGLEGLACPSRLQVAAEAPIRLDQALAEGVAELTLESVDSPLLALGLANLRAERLGLDVEVLDTSRQAIDPSTTLEGAIDLLMRFSASTAKPSPATAMRCDIDDETYARLDAFARKTLIPASASSRVSGAGAGLSDSD